MKWHLKSSKTLLEHCLHLSLLWEPIGSFLVERMGKIDTFTANSLKLKERMLKKDTFVQS